MRKQISIGLIGFGNIGTGVVNALNVNRNTITERVPHPLRVTRIADLDIKTPRNAKYDPAILTTNADGILEDPNIDVVIELIPGLEPARTYIEKALRNHKHVVTANKALIAAHGTELLALAKNQRVGLLYEASVGAGIPIIRSLHRGLAANQFRAVVGIINGTANFILTSMAEHGKSFHEALLEAQRLGYAEADPTLDIEGIDTAHKITILASLVFGQDLRFNDVYVEGITSLMPADFIYAAELGYSIKLLGIARKHPDERVELRVHPALVPKTSLLSAVSGVFNGIMVEGEPVGIQMFYGKGAGPGSTSSAIISDLMVIASGIEYGGLERENPLTIPVGVKHLKPMNDLETPYYLRFSVLDKPGTMAKLSTLLGARNISIASMIQKTLKPGDFATLIIVTHAACEASLQTALAEIARLDICNEKPLLLRVEEQS